MLLFLVQQLAIVLQVLWVTCTSKRNQVGQQYKAHLLYLVPVGLRT